MNASVVLRNRAALRFWTRVHLRATSGAQVVPPVTRREPGLSTVTVIVPCYNYARYLPACVTSVLTQQGVVVDVVVVDDASTDGTADLVEELAALDPRVRLVARPTNGGPVAAFNEGLRHVSGTYVVRLDADDLLTQGALARATDLMDEVSSVGLVYGRPRHFTGVVPVVRPRQARSWSIWPGAEWLAWRCRLGVNCITSPEVVMRTSVVQRLGGQHEELQHAHDMEMWMRVAGEADIARVNGVDQALHRDHELSRSTTLMAGALVDLRERRRAFELLLASDVFTAEVAARLGDSARRALAREALTRACRVYEQGRAREEPTDDLVRFAKETWPGATSLRVWSALVRRRTAGRQAGRRAARFFAPSGARKLCELVALRRWHRLGV
jgi:hypothetical protein